MSPTQSAPLEGLPLMAAPLVVVAVTETLELTKVGPHVTSICCAAGRYVELSG